ncbi:hypothetical protein K505DRAFT_337072 [Melanomma pulvis-pyrius CBS 109.77]|uniref:Uncharacterized protein n=1 Tax=Melanomma pulvis-pyrius CBS 109.77 TaxID=1314802 RepID=A0A6A6XEG4_9PLEO|nr:hypothetical protein K505DRAFT_337072 [Melanomma pulvis-pyrius CBS 109.77]
MFGKTVHLTSGERRQHKQRRSGSLEKTDENAFITAVVQLTSYPPTFTTSDTEPNDEDEELIVNYLNMSPSPECLVMSVFGPGVVVTRLIAGTLHPRIVEPRSRTIQASPDNPSPRSDTTREGDIHYPNLPSLFSFSSSQGLILQSSPTKQSPAILVHSPHPAPNTK